MKLYTKEYLTWPAIIPAILDEIGVTDTSDTVYSFNDGVFINCSGQKVDIPEDVDIVSCPYLAIGPNDKTHIKHWICGNMQHRFNLMDDLVIRLDIHASILMHMELLTSGFFLADSVTPFIDRIMDRSELPTPAIMSNLSIYEVLSSKELIEKSRDAYWTNVSETKPNAVSYVSKHIKLGTEIRLPYRVTYYRLYEFLKYIASNNGSVIYKDIFMSYIQNLPMSELFDDDGWKEEN